MPRMIRDLLDQQIIDAQGRKVVRVNDVTLLREYENSQLVLHVLEVDIGIRSMFAAYSEASRRRQSSAHCKKRYRRIPFAGSSVTSSKQIRSARSG